MRHEFFERGWLLGKESKNRVLNPHSLELYMH